MATSTIKVSDKALDNFLKDNPDFDLLHFDFHDHAELSKLDAQLKTTVMGKKALKTAVPGSEQQQMNLLVSQGKAKQRALRIASDASIADKLIEHGYDSAHKIASISQRKFVRLFAPVINDEQKASEIHARAVHIAETTMHLYANIKDTVASPHYNATSFKISDPESAEYFKNIPSYQELFGSLNYLECDECQSIFSPAAYFLDIMRITDEYITEPNISPVHTIPPRYKLEERRHDLFEMKLNCENTNTVIPYLQLVNEILKKNIERNDGIDDVYKTLSVGKYPFTLPFNLPLAKTRQYLERLEMPLYQVFQSILTTDSNSTANIHAFDVAREQINLSFQQFKLISKENFSVDALTASYGYNISYRPPSYDGGGRLLFLKDQSTVTGVGTQFTATVKVNDQITVADETKKVTAIVSDTKLTTETNWSVTSGATYTVKPSSPQTIDGQGTLAITLDNANVIGAGTAFTTQLNIGDQLDFAGITRTVVKIDSNTKILVNEKPPFMSANLSFTITKQSAPYIGVGAVVALEGSYTVIGMGTTFATDFSQGASIVINEITNSVVSVQSDTQLSVADTWHIDLGSVFTVMPQRSLKKIPAYLPHSGTGTLEFSIGSSLVMGTNTKFTTELSIGDQIRCAKNIRTVMTISSDTELTVSSNWEIITGGASFEILPVQGLDIVDNFIIRTGLTRANLDNLFVQDLSQQELDADVAKSLFINNTGENEPYLQTYFANDPANPVQRIQGITLKRLDRLNRFIRLEQLTGWSFADLNWLFMTCPVAVASDIDEKLVIYLAQVKTLQQVLPDTSIPALTALWSDMKTMGKVSDKNPADLFDTVFNNPLFLNGKDPYKDDVPFNPLKVPARQWVISSIDGINGVIRNRLAAALNLDTDNIALLGVYVNTLTGGSGNALSLTLSNLSWMYRISQWGALLDLNLDELFNLLCLKYYSGSPYLNPPAGSVQPGTDTYTVLSTAMQKLENNGLDIYQLNYLVKGETGSHYEPPYQPSEITPFVDELAAAALTTHLNASDLVFENTDNVKAAYLYTAMQNNYISQSGVFIKYEFTYNDAAQYFPVTRKNDSWVNAFQPDTFSLTYADISADESQRVFVELVSKSILITVNTLTTLSPEYADDIDLSFLMRIFNNADEAPKKISEVRLLLSQSKSAIAHTLKVWRDTEQKQQDMFEGWLSGFIASGQATVKSLKNYAASVSSLTGYLDAFLTPTSAASAQMESFIEVLSRGSLLVDHLSLTQKETTYITSAKGHSHFNIENLSNISIGNVMSLIDYRKLVTDFADRNDELIDYFQLQKNNSCPDTKIKKLGSITGWNDDQVCALITLFWPNDVEPLTDYDTVSGILRLQASFNASKKLGADIPTLLTFAAVGHLDLDPHDVFSEQNWDIYESIGNKAMDLAGRKFGDDSFTEVSNFVQGALNTQTRDVLLPFSIWKINANNPDIAQPSDLYRYLLIDVEMSSCALTSRIAQGIASVQLYMQRCRMMLESGVNIVDVPKIWWDWMSSYRVWEVNRKIFLYPENYIEPTLRKKITPAFKEFSDDLLQNDINKDTVKDPYEKYLQEINLLSNLVHVASYNTTRLDAYTGEEKETLFLIGRTNTQPYTYYMRKLDDFEDWGPWLKIDIAINASSVTPVYAFDRIFIFWTEKSVTQSGTVNGQTSSTETVDIVDMKFSFYDGEKWTHPQVLFNKTTINVFPSNYKLITDQALIIEKLDDRNFFWNIPYVISNGEGFVGSGRVGMSENLYLVQGTQTIFLREIKEGDVIWCQGESRVVASVESDKLMVVTKPWTKTVNNCEFKIVPQRGDAALSPYTGTGKVVVTAGMQNVTGKGTRFIAEIAYGDNIVIGDETRMVILVDSDKSLLVDTAWKVNAAEAEFTVTPIRDMKEQLIVMFGAEIPTDYKGELKPPQIESDPTKNLFIRERNNFNLSLYNSLSLAQDMSALYDKAYVTMGPIQILGRNLLKSDTKLTITNYEYASKDNPVPYGAVLDRQQAILVVRSDNNPLRNNYWGNNISGAANNQDNIDIANTKRLLYYTDGEKSSLINVGNQPGWFVFDNSDEAFLAQAQQPNLNKLTEMLLIRPYPKLPDMLNNKVISTLAFTVAPVPFNDLKFKFTRLTTSVISLLMQKLFAGGIDNLLTLRSQEIAELPFSRFYPAPGNTHPNSVIPPASTIMDFDGSYGLYFWEIFFHGPFLIADRLNMNQRYEDSKQWLEYIFNPTIIEDDSANPDPEKRYWRFRPFRTMERETLSKMLTNQAQIRRYNFDPFDPDAIAKYRHVAYAKAVVMKYIDNILDWGDFLFAQDTSESINQATNLYVLASDLLGKRPESQGKIPAPEAKSFNDIKREYSNQIPQFLIELENTPHVHAGETPVIRFSSVPFNKINSYFCVPENADFIGYWDRVEDRLFKIRHCQNIQGVYRQLPLFAPPIDPRAFIRAYAAGGGGFGLISSFSAPIPHFRFTYLIEKARSLTAQVSNLGNALLSALEKKDAEALNLIRLQQEKSVLQLTTTIKEMQIKAIEQQKSSQQEGLNNASYRYTHYDKLLKDGISQREQVSMDAALAAMILNTIGGITKTAASIGYAVPQVGSPFAMTYGGQQLGNALNAASGAFEIGAIISSYVSQQSLTMAGYDRRAQDWTLQRDIAGYDKAQIEAQLKETDIQKQIAEQDLVIHKQTIKNDDELEAFYKGKFTNKELYQWMSTRISTVYFQAYNLAYNMAKAAERAYQYQYNSNLSFINYGYWDGLYKGLGAAEGLMLALDQMDSSSTLDMGYRRLEIEKTVSLLQLNPKALLDLKTKGECVFEFNEKLFDYDFPGHYARKIKTLSISVPAVIGPYQNIHATLTQLNNQLVLKADKQGLDAVNYLLGGDVSKIPDNSILRSNCWVNQQIALSKGANDSGLFELNFEDARFLPFEGTGAVSTWKLSMPFATNRIHFDAISDVVIDMKYTAMDGGEKFKHDVTRLKAFKPYSGVGYCNFNQMYATAWYAFMNNHAGPETQTLSFDLTEFVPPHVLKAKLIGFYFRLDAAASALGEYITVKVSDTLSVSINLTPNLTPDSKVRFNDCTYIFKKEGKPEPLVSKVLGERSIAFDLFATPTALKGKDNFLNPDVVKNIETILFYDGEYDNT